MFTVFISEGFHFSKNFHSLRFCVSLVKLILVKEMLVSNKRYRAQPALTIGSMLETDPNSLTG